MAERNGSTAGLGIRALRDGIVATKYGRQSGKPHGIILRLSPDEQSLTWETRGLAKLKKNATKRAIRIMDIIELIVGRDSAVMSHAQSDLEHLSVSLILRASLPAAPSAHDARSGGRSLASSSSQRETLDLTIADEEQFGLFVAAIRTLAGLTGAVAAGRREREALQAEVERLRSALSDEQSRQRAQQAAACTETAALTAALAMHRGADSSAPGLTTDGDEAANASPPAQSSTQQMQQNSPPQTPPDEVADGVPFPCGSSSLKSDQCSSAAFPPPDELADAGSIGSSAALESPSASSSTVVAVGVTSGGVAGEEESDYADDEDADDEDADDSDVSSAVAPMEGGAASAAMASHETELELERRIMRLEALLVSTPAPSMEEERSSGGLALPGGVALTGGAVRPVDGGFGDGDGAASATEDVNPFGVAATDTSGAEAVAEQLFGGEDSTTEADRLFGADPRGIAGAEAVAEQLFGGEDTNTEAGHIAGAQVAAGALFAEEHAGPGAESAAGALFGASADVDVNPFSCGDGEGNVAARRSSHSNPFEPAQPPPRRSVNPF